MKKKLLFSLALICTLGFFSSCSDDDDEPNRALSVSCSGENLQMTYSGASMPGKKVTFSTLNGKEGEMVLEGSLDLKSIMDKMTKGLMDNIAPGVIPGELKTTITKIPLQVVDDKYVFSGVDSQNGRTFAYDGKFEMVPGGNNDKGKMVLNITDVTFPDHALSGKWNVVKYIAGKDNPIHAVWETDATLQGIGTETILPVVLNLIPIKNDLNIQVLLNRVLRDVDFCKDGNIIASYSEKGNIMNPDYQSSPLNIAQYYVDSDHSLRLYLNPTMIISSIKTKAKEYKLPDEVIQTMVTELLPLLGHGFPLKYKVANNKACVYADKELVGKLFTILIPLFKDEAFIDMVLVKIKETPIGKDPKMLDFIGKVLKDVPAFLDKTTKIELGINLVR